MDRRGGMESVYVAKVEESRLGGDVAPLMNVTPPVHHINICAWRKQSKRGSEQDYFRQKDNESQMKIMKLSHTWKQFYLKGLSFFSSLCCVVLNLYFQRLK